MLSFTQWISLAYDVRHALWTATSAHPARWQQSQHIQHTCNSVPSNISAAAVLEPDLSDDPDRWSVMFLTKVQGENGLVAGPYIIITMKRVRVGVYEPCEIRSRGDRSWDNTSRDVILASGIGNDGVYCLPNFNQRNITDMLYMFITSMHQ